MIGTGNYSFLKISKAILNEERNPAYITLAERIGEGSYILKIKWEVD